jgi:hypothetical protein
MALIDDVKLALRISGTATDTEISDLILSAKADLGLSGISVVDTDALTKRAISLYCKANYGYDNPDVDKFQKSYLDLKTFLSSAADYAKAVT